MRRYGPPSNYPVSTRIPPYKPHAGTCCPPSTKHFHRATVRRLACRIVLPLSATSALWTPSGNPVELPFCPLRPMYPAMGNGRHLLHIFFAPPRGSHTFSQSFQHSCPRNIFGFDKGQPVCLPRQGPTPSPATPEWLSLDY